MYICLCIIINITSCVLNDNAICLYFLDGVCQNKHFEKPTRSGIPSANAGSLENVQGET